MAPQQTHRTNMCPPGFRKKEQSEDCEACQSGEYTDIHNTDTKCQRCSPQCGHQKIMVEKCTNTSNIKCACREGTFDSGGGICTQCFPTSNPTENCQREECKNHTNYKKKCLGTTSPITTVSLITSTTTTSTTVQSPKTRTSNPSINPLTPIEVSYVTWMILLLTAVMVFCLVTYLFRNLLRYQNLCPSWCAEKDVEFSEQQSDQSSAPTTLIISNSEGTPMLTLSPATPEHPAHVRPLLPPPTSVRTVARDEVQSEHWPAIVLYTIIKEVPLRRWKEFLRLLKVADNQLERVELEAGLGSIERQYQMLRLWSQRPSSNLDEVFSALRYMDLSGCAQLLMESLERLQWRNEQKQGVTAHRGFTDWEFTGDICKTRQDVLTQLEIL
ncbi:tumor necrosis factor receptor superfamily member 1A isoform X2 [Sphaeramia orbicularis]|nr:tumor necrosis factor receptor superfamily member 1A-like isoform X2 [Sphaeramia orbicularis]